MIGMLACALLAGPAAYGASLTGLYNTGTANVDGAIDPNYMVTSYSGDAPPTGADVSIVSSSNESFPFPYWATTGDSSAAWISPDGRNTTDPTVAGVYLYKTTFTIAGSLEGVAGLALGGVWSADNDAEGFNVNGYGFQASTGSPLSEPACACNNLFAFDIFIPAADLLAGTNTIFFEVTNFAQNGGNPTGLYVDYNPDETGLVPGRNVGGNSSIPEPFTILLFGACLIGGATILRRGLTKVRT